jgi:hypothetical protein
MQLSVARAETPWLVRWETTGALRRGGQQSLAREDEVRVLVEAVDTRAARGPGAVSPGREAGAVASATFDAVYADTARVAQELAAMLVA